MYSILVALEICETDTERFSFKIRNFVVEFQLGRVRLKPHITKCLINLLSESLYPKQISLRSCEVAGR